MNAPRTLTVILGALEFLFRLLQLVLERREPARIRLRWNGARAAGLGAEPQDVVRSGVVAGALQRLARRVDPVLQFAHAIRAVDAFLAAIRLDAPGLALAGLRRRVLALRGL